MVPIRIRRASRRRGNTSESMVVSLAWSYDRNHRISRPCGQHHRADRLLTGSAWPLCSESAVTSAAATGARHRIWSFCWTCGWLWSWHCSGEVTAALTWNAPRLTAVGTDGHLLALLHAVADREARAVEDLVDQEQPAEGDRQEGHAAHQHANDDAALAVRLGLGGRWRVCSGFELVKRSLARLPVGGDRGARPLGGGRWHSWLAHVGRRRRAVRRHPRAAWAAWAALARNRGGGRGVGRHHGWRFRRGGCAGGAKQVTEGVLASLPRRGRVTGRSYDRCSAHLGGRHRRGRHRRGSRWRHRACGGPDGRGAVNR